MPDDCFGGYAAVMFERVVPFREVIFFFGAAPQMDFEDELLMTDLNQTNWMEA